MNKSTLLFFLIATLFGVLSIRPLEGEMAKTPIHFIPIPASMEKKQGHFKFDKNTIIEVINGNGEALRVAGYFKSLFHTASGLELPVIERKNTTGRVNTIYFELTETMKEDEGYELEVDVGGIGIKARNASGLFYGVQTLRQLLPLAIDVAVVQDGIDWMLPTVDIKDRPRFGWRGMHLDVSRHFFPKAFIKKYIDHLARYKFNVFHWHLVDGAGWRVEVDRYPKLIDIGAWRVDKRKNLWNWEATEIGKPTDGREAYGGYYTKEDIREIVQYAAERFITVVPEIEMPGHSYAALVAYPELLCINNDIIGNITFGTDVFCAGNKKSYRFLENVLDEIMEIFPSQLIHIGGDEVVKTAWHNCPRCRRLMKKKGLQNEEELQSYFIKRMVDYIESKEREVIGWDEITEGGLAKNAKVMSWRGMRGGIESANKGHDVVMAPNSHTYFDLYQGDPQLEPNAYSRLLLSQVYRFDPVPKDIVPERRHHILGGHGCLWTENIQVPEQAEYMLFPRLFALAETLWSPKENLDWDHFLDRMEFNFHRLERAGIHYARSAYNVNINCVLDATNRHLLVTMKSEINRHEIRYTLDGSEPDRASSIYKKPFELTEKTRIQAATFREDRRYSKTSSREFNLNKATGKKVTYIRKYSPRYTAQGDGGLVNGLNGSQIFYDGQWQGIQQYDIEVTIDLEEEQDINVITTHFLHQPSVWIYLPQRVEFAISSDGQYFRTMGEFGRLTMEGNGIKTYEKFFETQRARYIRVIGVNIEHRPDNVDQKAWVFIDEIIVE